MVSLNYYAIISTVFNLSPVEEALINVSNI